MNDQQVATLEKIAPYVGYVTVGYLLIATPIIMSVVAGVLYMVFNIFTGGTATFKQIFTVLVHTMPIGVLAQIFTVPLNYARETMTSGTTLAVLMPMFDDTSFMGGLLGAIDLFIVWSVFVLAIGLAVLYRRRTQPIAIGLFVLYAVIAVIIALVKSSTGS
jgi:hypothetical protein